MLALLARALGGPHAYGLNLLQVRACLACLYNMSNDQCERFWFLNFSNSYKYWAMSRATSKPWTWVLGFL